MQSFIKRTAIIALCLIATAAFMLFASCGQSTATSGEQNSNGPTTSVVTPGGDNAGSKKDESLLPEEDLPSRPSKPSKPSPSLPDEGDDDNGNEEHKHVYNVMKAEEKYFASAGSCDSKPQYYYSCECGEASPYETFEYGDYVHDFCEKAREEFLKINPTCTTKGVYYKSCIWCGEKSDETFEGDISPHNFDKQVVDEKFLAEAATCWSQARYYYSCECGEKDETHAFSAGEKRAHDFSLEKVSSYNDNLASDATCEKGKIYYKYCAYADCPEYSNDLNYSFEYGKALGHDFNKKIETDEHCAAMATCTEAAKYYVSCERCGKNDVKTFVSGSAKGHNYNAEEECLTCHIKPSAGIVYKINGETAYVESYGDCTDKDVVLRSKYNGKPVTKIADEAFYNCTGIKSVTIKDGVTSIGAAAFKNCGCLKSVDIPDSVTDIGGSAFYNCVKLTDVVLPERLTELQGYVFMNCKKLYSLVIPDSVTTIGPFALYGCYNLRSLTIGSGLKSLSDATFGENNVKTYHVAEIINKSALYQEAIYKKLLHFTKTGEKVLNYKTSGESDIIYKDGFMFYDYDQPYLIGYAGDVEPELVLPDYDGKDYKVYDYAFYGQRELVSLTIGENIISIGVKSFDLCYKLVNVNDESDGKCIIDSTSGAVPNYMKKDVLREGNFIFAESGDDCRLLSYVGDESEITLPETCNGKKYYIADYAFEDCYCLNKVNIGDGVIGIESSAFWNCYGLVEVTMGVSVKSIGAFAFQNCEKLQNLTLGENLETIGTYAFWYCSSLKTVTIPDKVTTIIKYAFSDCVSLETVVIGESVTSIGAATFYKCENISSLTFKNYTGWCYYVEETPSDTKDVEFTQDAEANAKKLYDEEWADYMPESDLRGMCFARKDNTSEDIDWWGEEDE